MNVRQTLEQSENIIQYPVRIEESRDVAMLVRAANESGLDVVVRSGKKQTKAGSMSGILLLANSDSLMRVEIKADAADPKVQKIFGAIQHMIVPDMLNTRNLVTPSS